MGGTRVPPIILHKIMIKHYFYQDNLKSLLLFCLCVLQLISHHFYQFWLIVPQYARIQGIWRDSRIRTTQIYPAGPSNKFLFYARHHSNEYIPYCSSVVNSFAIRGVNLNHIFSISIFEK